MLHAEARRACSSLSHCMLSAGERTPNWPGSSGVLIGLRPGQMRPGLLYRAALEGATYSLLNGECFESSRATAPPPTQST